MNKICISIASLIMLFLLAISSFVVPARFVTGKPLVAGAAPASAKVGAAGVPNSQAKTYFVDDGNPQTFGGNGGNPFSDPGGVTSKGLISKIQIRCAREIDAIRLYYGDGTIANVGSGIGDWHGGDGGELKEWEVPPGQRIVRVDGRAQDRVDQLQFFTDKNVSSPVFGGGGGRPFKATSLDGAGLRTISGRSGARIDQVTFHFGLPNFVEKIDYDADALRKAGLKFTPTRVDSNTLTNKRDIPQQMTYAGKVEVTNESSFNWEIGASLSISNDFEASLPLVAKGSTTITVGLESKVAKGETQRTTSEHSWSVPIKVPPRSSATCVSTMKKHTMDIPFTYTVAWYAGSRRNVVKRETFAGIYRGVNFTELRHTCK